MLKYLYWRLFNQRSIGRWEEKDIYWSGTHHRSEPHFLRWTNHRSWLSHSNLSNETPKLSSKAGQNNYPNNPSAKLRHLLHVRQTDATCPRKDSVLQRRQTSSGLFWQDRLLESRAIEPSWLFHEHYEYRKHCQERRWYKWCFGEREGNSRGAREVWCKNQALQFILLRIWVEEWS